MAGRVPRSSRAWNARDAAHLRGRVVRVAEDDRLRRARLRAGGHDLAVRDLPPLVARATLGEADALDTEGALLHDPARADRDVGVELHVERPLEPGVAPVERSEEHTSELQSHHD